jgi:hypothetical protein
MDLLTGAVSVWYRAAANMSVFILGFDGDGHAVVAVTESDSAETKELLLLTGPQQTVQIAPHPTGGPQFEEAFGDKHGLWLAARGSLWLYRPASLFKVADIPLATNGGRRPTPTDEATGGAGQQPLTRVVGPCS